MGEIAEMMLDGTMCAGCGEFLNDGEDGDGFPEYCSACAPDYEEPKKSKRPAVKRTAELKTTASKCQSAIDKMLDGVEKSLKGKLSKETRKMLIGIMNVVFYDLKNVEGWIVSETILPLPTDDYPNG